MFSLFISHLTNFSLMQNVNVWISLTLMGMETARKEILNSMVLYIVAMLKNLQGAKTKNLNFILILVKQDRQ